MGSSRFDIDAGFLIDAFFGGTDKDFYRCSWADFIDAFFMQMQIFGADKYLHRCRFFHCCIFLGRCRWVWAVPKREGASPAVGRPLLAGAYHHLWSLPSLVHLPLKRISVFGQTVFVYKQLATICWPDCTITYISWDASKRKKHSKIVDFEILTSNEFL